MRTSSDRPAHLIRQFVQHGKGGDEQRVRHQPPVNRFPVIAGEQFQHEGSHMRRALGGSCRRRSGRMGWSGAASIHFDIISYYAKPYNLVFFVTTDIR